MPASQTSCSWAVERDQGKDEVARIRGKEAERPTSKTGAGAGALNQTAPPKSGSGRRCPRVAGRPVRPRRHAAGRPLRVADPARPPSRRARPPRTRVRYQSARRSSAACPSWPAHDRPVRRHGSGRQPGAMRDERGHPNPGSSARADLISVWMKSSPTKRSGSLRSRARA